MRRIQSPIGRKANLARKVDAFKSRLIEDI